MLYASSNVVAAVIPYFFKGRSCFVLQYKPMQPRQPLNFPNSFIFSFIILYLFVYACKDIKKTLYHKIKYKKIHIINIY